MSKGSKVKATETIGRKSPYDRESIRHNKKTRRRKVKEKSQEEQTKHKRSRKSNKNLHSQRKQ